MKEVGTKILSINDKDYQDWLVELKTRFKQSQIKAAIKVNSELIRFYWSLGRDIVKMKSETRWGQKFYQSLSKDLKELLPNCGGMSPSNLGYMFEKFRFLFLRFLVILEFVPSRALRRFA